MPSNMPVNASEPFMPLMDRLVNASEKADVLNAELRTFAKSIGCPCGDSFEPFSLTPVTASKDVPVVTTTDLIVHVERMNRQNRDLLTAIREYLGM